MNTHDKTVAVLGLGYVGLPLALAFGRKLRTIGFDVNERKIHSYKKGEDPAGELEKSLFREATKLEFTTDPRELKHADYVIIAVPTPVDAAKQPDLSPLVNASTTAGKHLKKGAVVIYESTVYPGVTEDVCAPILEKESGLKAGVDFKVGYSPERMNPSDREHTLERIIKVVSGQDNDSLAQVAWLYGLVIDAGVYQAPSIKAAEAAKVIENTQRDLNIALMNELAIIFKKMGIDTLDVIKTASTKWNFLPFKPGLVGGHCIGVDPYYLTYKAEMLGYHPEVVLAGRRINDGMGKYIAEQTIKELIAADRPVKNSKVLVLGLTFKENCRDLRNSRVIDIIQELKTYGVTPYVWDPVANTEEAFEEYQVNLVSPEKIDSLDAVVAAVAHKEILQMDLVSLIRKTGPKAPFIDVKSVFDRETLARVGFRVWRL